MAYPRISRYIQSRANGTFAVVHVSHEIDRHGDRQDYTHEVGVRATQAEAFTLAAKSDIFA